MRGRLRAADFYLESKMSKNANGEMLLEHEQALYESIKTCLSPDAAACIVAFLQPATLLHPKNPDAISAIKEVEWFAEFLTSMLGVG